MGHFSVPAVAQGKSLRLNSLSRRDRNVPAERLLLEEANTKCFKVLIYFRENNTTFLGHLKIMSMLPRVTRVPLSPWALPQACFTVSP